MFTKSKNSGHTPKHFGPGVFVSYCPSCICPNPSHPEEGPRVKSVRPGQQVKCPKCGFSWRVV